MIRASWLIRGSIALRINRIARIHHDKRRSTPIGSAPAFTLILLVLERLVLADCRLRGKAVVEVG